MSGSIVYYSHGVCGAVYGSGSFVSGQVRGFKQKQQSHKVQKQLSEFNRCQTVASEGNPLTIMHIQFK